VVHFGAGIIGFISHGYGGIRAIAEVFKENIASMCTDSGLANRPKGK
jgi:hypothetical protein